MGGLPATVTELYAQEETGISMADGALEKYRLNLDALIEKDEKFLKPIGEREGWNTKFDEAIQSLDEARETIDRDAKPLLEKNDSDDAQKLILSLN